MQTKVRALNEESIRFFHTMWSKHGKVPFVGEFDAPMRFPGSSNHEWATKVCNVDASKVSHLIKDVLIDTYDKTSQTIMIDVDFCGPFGSQAASLWVANRVRFMPRIVEINDIQHGKQIVVKRLITWDLVHRPDDLTDSESSVLKQITGQDKI